MCVYACACRKCLAFVLVPVLERELQAFKELWNTHTIRYNRRIEAPHGIPNDLYAMPSESGYFQELLVNYYHDHIIIGGSDQRCTVNVAVWAHLMHQASEPPAYYDATFEFLAQDFLQRYYNISQDDFMPSNISEIYCNMVEHFT